MGYPGRVFCPWFSSLPCLYLRSIHSPEQPIGLSTAQLKAQKGDTVFVHYLGRFPGGKVFDTSMEKEAIAARLYNRARDYKPLQVTLGTGKSDSWL